MSNTLGRLTEVLDQIQDEHLKRIVDGVFKVEMSYRSTEAINFPRQKIRDIVDASARMIEAKGKEDGV